MQIRWRLFPSSLVLCVFAWIVLDLRPYRGDTHTHCDVCQAVTLFRNSIRLIEWIAFCWKSFSILCIKCLFALLNDFFLPFDQFATPISFRSHFTLFLCRFHFSIQRNIVNILLFVFVLFRLIVDRVRSLQLITLQKNYAYSKSASACVRKPNGSPVKSCMSIETTRSVGLHLTFWFGSVWPRGSNSRQSKSSGSELATTTPLAYTQIQT